MIGAGCISGSANGEALAMDAIAILEEKFRNILNQIKESCQTEDPSKIWYNSYVIGFNPQTDDEPGISTQQVREETRQNNPEARKRASQFLHDLVVDYEERVTLKALRLRADMTQAELAQKAHVHQDLISKLEKDLVARNPTHDILQRIRLALGATEEEMGAAIF